MITFVCYPKCTTCQKAQKWLDAHQIAYALRDIKADNPTAEELAAWHRLSGLPLKKIFNTSGLLYRSLELKDKLPDMTEEEMLALLATDGMLVKRPILVGDEFVLVGFKEKEFIMNRSTKKPGMHSLAFCMCCVRVYRIKFVATRSSGSG